MMSSASRRRNRRLLTSVAIIGRENEPIYLLGELWDHFCSSCDNEITADPAAASPRKTTTAVIAATTKEKDVNATLKATPSPSHDDENKKAITEKNSPSKGQRGLFGRMMMTKKNDDNNKNNNNNTIASAASTISKQQQQLNNNNTMMDGGDDIDDDDDDDPFGFFETNLSNPQKQQQQQQRMSLIQQMVLHASLDVFEERASCTFSSRTRRLSGGQNYSGSKSGLDGGISEGGGVRWRTPGTDSATSMYMGLLCCVDERWSVYGYLTNTGIKFLAMVEDNIHCSSTTTTTTISAFHDDDEDDLFHYPSLPSWIDEESSSTMMTEVETKQMKQMFTQLHDLYVRYTMNPFSRLRSPICSIKFDIGVIALARSFNGVLEGEGGVRSPKSSLSVATRKEFALADDDDDDDDDVGSTPVGGGGQKFKKKDGLSWV